MSTIEGPKRSGKVWRWLILATLGLGGVGVYSVVKQGRETTIVHRKQELPKTVVDLVSPKHPTEAERLTLPANVEAFYTAPIHARLSGFVKMWYYDIGAKVKAGDVLARIDTPDLDQQFEQTRGEYAKAEADLNLAQLTAARWKELRVSQAVSQQTADEKTGEALARQAQADAAKANVDRLKALQGFKDIIAPFDGVVTARRIDVGALVSASNSDQPGLFDVASVDRLRVYVRVPQVYTGSLKKGMIVTLTLPQYPGRTFKAVLATTADAISQQSRALLVELDLDNKNKLLSPGAYAQARFDLPLDPDKLVVPSSAVIFRNASAEVAVVGSDDKVVLKPIEITLDAGMAVEIAGGLSLADKIIASPSDSIATGDVVKVTSVDGKNAD
jgi:RND family efflux transporter MFP subunit